MSRLKKSTWKWIIPFLIMIITLILFRMIFLLGYVPTESMEPTLKKDSYIVGVRIYSKLETGDIIIFHHDGKLLIKRIAAVKNEQIEMCIRDRLRAMPVWQGQCTVCIRVMS